ncbi:hypothetical protein D3C81_1651780 [compost metagenome]
MSVSICDMTSTIRSDEASDCSASLRTSEATTAKPRPSSPARAASIDALSASRFVCWEIPRIAATIKAISCDLSFSSRTSELLA